MSKWTTSIESAQSHTIPRGVVVLGQADLLSKINPFLKSNKQFPHTLLIGEPGMGKTTLARFIAQEKKIQFVERTAPVTENDVPVIGVFLLDEAHLQKSPEYLFQEMDRSIGLTLIAATTMPHKMDQAWRSRFTLRLTLEDYSDEAMAELGRHMIPDVPEDALEAYASASGGNPRQMERIATVALTVGAKNVEKVLSTVELTIDGLSQIHLAYLRCLNNMGHAVGLTQVAAMTYNSELELRSAERRLLKLGLIDFTGKGRDITRTGRQYIQAFDG